MALTSDDLIAMHKATTDVIEAEQGLDDMSNEAKIAVLRSAVRSLAVVQRDLLKAMLGG